MTLVRETTVKKLIIHDSYRWPVRVRIVNSRLTVYEVVYGDGFGDVARDLITRIAPKAGPLAKQFAMKAADVVKDKAIGPVGNLAEKAFQSIKDRIIQLIRRKKQLPEKLPSTEAMPASVIKVVNKGVNQKLAELAATEFAEHPITSKALQDSITANLIAGSGFR